MEAAWRPSASIKNLQARSQLLWDIRQFFHERDMVEVQTPLLGRATVTDRYIESYAVADAGFLQTSPEYFLKRLLAAGMPSCYQLASVFRDNEVGRWHNPEFTMLEWYRLGYSAAELRQEVSELVNVILGEEEFETWSFRELILKQLAIDIDKRNSVQLDKLLSPPNNERGIQSHEMYDFLYVCATTKKLPGRLFITNFPAENAALAKTCMVNGVEVADRFELLIDQLEIANGYDELLDAEELNHRMNRDNQLRSSAGLPMVSTDSKLLDAMQHGLPPCAGVALGVDRLCALKVQANSLKEVVAFTSETI